MLSDLLKSKRVLGGLTAVVVIGGVSSYFLTREPEVSSMKEIKTTQASKKNDEKSSPSASNDVIFDEKSETASDGISILKGDYKLSDVLELADLANFKYSGKDYTPTREEAVFQAKLQQPSKTVIGSDIRTEAGDMITVDVIPMEKGKQVDDLTYYNIQLPLGIESESKDYLLDKAATGLALNKETSREIKYPDDYKLDHLAGRTITYKLTVKSVLRPNEPSNAEVDKVYKALVDNANYSNSYKKVGEAKLYLRDNSKVKAYPEDKVKELQKEYETFIFTDKYEDETDFLERTNTSKEEYLSGRSEYVKSEMKDVLILQALSDKTGITMDSGEFKDLLTDQMTMKMKRDLLFELCLQKLLK